MAVLTLAVGSRQTVQINLPRRTRQHLGETSMSTNAKEQMVTREGSQPASAEQRLKELGINVSLPGLEREVAQAIVDVTHGETCAYSNATRGNIDVTLNLV
jgi:organic hydroperoxide reductase OsmC/OhrA